MTDSGARRGAANFAPVLMIVSFLLMIAFLVWLGMTSEGTEPVTMEEDDNGAEQADSMELSATRVTPDELGQMPQNFEGQTVRVASEVASAVGSEAFLMDFPQSPFLVKMDSTLVAGGRAVPQGDVIVTGTVLVMSDSVVTAWADAGSIGENERPLVEFATHFIEASRIRAGRMEEEPAGGDAAGDTTAGSGDEQQN